MKNTIQFKIRGVDRLLTYEQLINCEKAKRLTRIRVIDLQTQRNWVTNFNTVVSKFK
jgi:hypothetical protein